MTLSPLPAALRRLRRDRRGNVLMLFGLGLVPMTVATGMGIDYARAMRLQTKLNAAADAAALAAVSKSLEDYDPSIAKFAAIQMFKAQTGTLIGAGGLTLNYNDPNQFNVVVTDTSASTNTRTATVTFRGQSANAFAGVLGMASLTVKGVSTTQSSTAPDIDFYLAIDISPSMAIAATQAGMDKMVANTQQQVDGSGYRGCAFGCHQTDTSSGPAGNPIDPSTGKRMDNYALAKSLGVTLRGDLVTEAATDLMDTAKNASQQNGAAYRMSISSFDAGFRTPQSLTSDLSAAKTAASKIQTMSVMKSSYNTDGTRNNDELTNYSGVQSGLDAITPATPGQGTGKSGDTPQGVIFLITDGVRDEARGGNINNRWIGEFERPTDATSWCSKTKTRGFRIAILYTEYLPLPNGFYNSQVKPFQPDIGTNLQACASPGLYYKVTTDGDISAALAGLFQQAIATAHITQ